MSLPSNIKQLLRTSGRNNNISISELEAIISEVLSIGGGSAAQVEYDSSEETGGNLVADKTDLQAAVKEARDWLNEPSQSLGTFNPAMTFDGSGEYSDYTPASSSTVTFTATGIKSGNTQWVKIITDGTVTFAAGSGCELLSGSLGLLQAGTYKFGFGSIFGAVQIIVPGTEQSTQLSTPVITASSQDSAIRIVFSSEDLASTGRELLRSTVNDVQTASSVAGFDGTADYVDDNNGAGLTNGTTYYYWGRNTAPGYTNSAYATDNAAPSASVTQLTQPTGLTATGGNNTVALAYDAIDANADDVAVQRSLTSGSGFATIATISRALTAYDDNTAVNGTTYYYRLIANGSGSYSNSNPSSEASATPAPSSFVPSDLGVKLLRFYDDARTASNVTVSGTDLLTWIDQAGNQDLDTVQGTPQWSAANGISFVDVSHDITGAFARSTPFEFFIIFTPRTSIDTNDKYLEFFRSSTTTDTITLQFGAPSTISIMERPTNNYIVIPSALAVDQKMYVYGRYDGASSSLTANGTTNIGTLPAVGSVTKIAVPVDSNLGAEADYITLVVTDILTTEERNNMITWLNSL